MTKEWLADVLEVLASRGVRAAKIPTEHGTLEVAFAEHVTVEPLPTRAPLSDEEKKKRYEATLFRSAGGPG